MPNSPLLISYLVLTKLLSHSIEYDEMLVAHANQQLIIHPCDLLLMYTARDISNGNKFQRHKWLRDGDDDELVMRCRPWPTTTHTKRVDIQIDRLISVLSVNFKLIAFDFVWMQKMRICAHIRRIIVISTIFARKLNLNKIMNNWGDLQCAELFALFGLVN